MYVGIEIGGTKVVMAAGTGPEDLTAPMKFPTEAPEATFKGIIQRVRAYQQAFGRLDAIGIASFGPLGVSAKDSHYGVMRKTPKPGWSYFDMLTPLRAAFPGVPIVIDTDVNGAALGEQRWGGARGLENFAYVTIGTGIGVGVVAGGRPVHGQLHPEAGHILVCRDVDRDPYPCRCPFHNNCLEGLASGPTILDRTGIRGEDLPDGHPLWAILGEYLAQLYYTITLMTSPHRILIGGGVGLKPEVLTASRDHLFHLLGGYLEAFEDRSKLDDYIQSAELADLAGVLGAIALVSPS